MTLLDGTRTLNVGRYFSPWEIRLSATYAPRGEMVPSHKLLPNLARSQWETIASGWMGKKFIALNGESSLPLNWHIFHNFQSLHLQNLSTIFNHIICEASLMNKELSLPRTTHILRLNDYFHVLYYIQCIKSLIYLFCTFCGTICTLRKSQKMGCSRIPPSFVLLVLHVRSSLSNGSGQRRIAAPFAVRHLSGLKRLESSSFRLAWAVFFHSAAVSGDFGDFRRRILFP